MKVDILSKELIKPYNSTKPSFQHYRISLVDELCPTMNTPVILYYPRNTRICGTGDSTSHSGSSILKKALSKALTPFYPLAGRYMKDDYMVECSDDGAYFVEATVDVELHDLLGRGEYLKVDRLNCLLPYSIGASDEISDPLLAVQLSTFACGGYAIAIMTSHRVADMSTTCTFIKQWATDSKRLLEGAEEDDHMSTSPSWNSAFFFPGKKLSPIPFGIPRAKESVEDLDIITKKFYFNKSDIIRIRDKAKLESLSEKLPSKVQSVLGIIGKAIIDFSVANPANPKRFMIAQALNMRERMHPPLPKDHCGNMFLFTSAESVADKKGVELPILVKQLSGSVSRALEDCKTLLSLGDEGQMIIAHAFNNLTNRTISKPEHSIVCVFSDWTKFPFYETDFGWGLPIWVSAVYIPVQNSAILISDKSGEGIEAWVNLNVGDLSKFQNAISWNLLPK